MHTEASKARSEGRCRTGQRFLVADVIEMRRHGSDCGLWYKLGLIADNKHIEVQ